MSSDADDAYDALVEGGYDEDVATIVRDQLRVKELESYATEIRELLEVKSRLVHAKAAELFRVLAGSSGLNHVLPTSTPIEHRGISDTLDLAVNVSSTDRGDHVRFIWKTHNIYAIETIPEGFSLGDLNVGKRREHAVETQIPVLEMSIRTATSGRRTLFSGPAESDGATEVRFRLNRSWIEHRSSSSDAALDSDFASALEFIDFLSDHANNPVYALVMTLIGDVSEVLSRYLDEKRRFIAGLVL
ncbi:MAG: hypothetical protein EA382_10785 [Spirochaetaceae bacterium]|nr:MAG: hypothetical protein EA382_10785 [Spirochaetaceae bacterium]